MDRNKYFWQVILNYVKRLKKEEKVDKAIQTIYDQNSFGYDEVKDADLLMQLQNYNLTLEEPYLATGQSSYFNNQIELNGLSQQKLNLQDIEDAKFISQSFGITTNYTDNNVPITYVTLLGTTEFYYATQRFPAGIFEDVFQCSPNHSWPIQPIVGELEKDFYLRLLEYQIDNSEYFFKENKNEVMMRGKRLIDNFCVGKNRVYLIKMSDALKIKASFGDIDGLRDGKLNYNDAKNKISTLHSLNDLMNSFNISRDLIYFDPNMTSEYGIALYGTIPYASLKYIEVQSKYDFLQKRALNLGYNIGDIIPIDFNIITEEEQKFTSGKYK